MLKKKRCYEVLEDRRLLAAQGFDLVQAFQADITRQSFVTDVDQDGLDDIVMAFHVQGDVQWKHNLADVAGQGDVFGLPQTLFRVPDGFSAMATADLDANGKTDFLAASETYSWFLASDTNLEFQQQASEIQPLARIQTLMVSDADANGNRFVVAASESHVELLSFDLDRNLKRLDMIELNLYRPERMQLADWDADGNVELFAMTNVPDIRTKSVVKIDIRHSQFSDPVALTHAADDFLVLPGASRAAEAKIMVTQWNNWTLHARQQDQLAPLVSRTIPDSTPTLTIDDLDGDGVNEILALGDAQLVRLDFDLQLLSQFPMTLERHLDQSLTPRTLFVGQVTLDDRREFIVQTDATMSWYTQSPGTFDEIETFALNHYLSDAADFDQDGQDDLVMRASKAREVWLSSQNFTPVPLPALPPGSTGVTIQDVDGDGFLDFAWQAHSTIYATRFDANQQQFRPVETLVEASANISSFRIQDLDGDGLPDIVLIKIESFLGTLDVLLNQRDQRYELAQSFANVTSLTGDIAIADLDGNDAPDIAVGSIDASSVPLRNSISVLFNRQGRFEDPLQSFIGRREFLATLDANGNGRDELLVNETTTSSSSPSTSLLEWDSETNRLDVVTNLEGGIQRVTRVRDEDGDGRDDIRAISDLGYSAWNGTENGLERTRLFNPAGRVTFATLVDVDNDDVDEFVFANSYASQLTTSFADPTYASAGQPSFPVQTWHGSYANFHVAGDFDGDGQTDWATLNGSGLYVAAAGSSSHELQSWFDASQFDLDGVIDVFALHQPELRRDIIGFVVSNRMVQLDLLAGHAVSTPGIAFPERKLFAQDLNLDGRTDLIWTERDAADNTYHVMWARQTEHQYFQAPERLDSVGELQFYVNDIWSADLNGDAKNDVVVATRADIFVALSDDNGLSRFKPLNGQFHANAIRTADLDDDGDQDLVARSSMMTVIYENDGDGNLRFQQRVGSLQQDSWADTFGNLLLADLDADGRIDIGSSSTWYRNQTNRFGERAFEPQVDRLPVRFDVVMETNPPSQKRVLDLESGQLYQLTDVPEPPRDSSFVPARDNLHLALLDAVWADVDGDGTMEIIAADRNALWLFEPVLDGWTSTKILDGRFDELAALDADQDGTDEIYQPQVRGWLRMDRGHWIGHIGNYDSSDTTFANAFDYDNDGDLDLGYSTGSGGYFSENIAGQLMNSQAIRLASQGETWVVGQLDSNGANDIVTASRRTLFLHFNIGSDTFNTNRPDRRILFDHNVLPALADLNHDGWTDLLVATGGQVRWFANSATGLADESQILAESDVADALAFHAQDTDGNGEIDFLLEGVSDTQILLANGGSYVRATLPGTDLKFAERDLDGSVKILSIGAHGQLQISSVTQDLAVTTSVIHQRYSWPVAADFDNDGQLEFLTYRGDRRRPVLAVTEAAAGENHIIVNEDYTSGQFPADVNGDGWLDVAIMENRSFTWFANQRGAAFEIQPTFDFEPSIMTQLADLDNDGDLDILRHVGSQGIVWNENLDDHFGSNQLLIDVESRVQQIVVFDANQDGFNELLVTFPSGLAQLHLGIGRGAIAEQPIALDIPWSVTTAADVDEDGRIDLLGDDGQWLRNAGHAFAEAVHLIPETHIAQVKDYYHDGDMDLAVDHFAGWRENNGQGEFSVRHELLPPEFANLEPRPIDLNLDGINEFLVTNPDIGMVESKLTYDFNADGRLSVADLQPLHAAIHSISDELRFDVNHDGRVSRIDGVVFVETILQRDVADVNADGVFDSADLVQMFQAGNYEQDATWSQGDLNLDGTFDSADLVFAFQRSAFRQGN